MTETEAIKTAYEAMYTAMIAKDGAALAEVLDDGFVLIHMTGMRQSKQAFVRAVLDGTLNYFSAKHEDMQMNVSGDTAFLTGKSLVSAAVFGGGTHTWRCGRIFRLENAAVNGRSHRLPQAPING